MLPGIPSHRIWYCGHVARTIRHSIVPLTGGIPMLSVPQASVSSLSAPNMDPETIWRTINERYTYAQVAQATKMTETAPDIVAEKVSGSVVRFVLRVASNLRDKPKDIGPRSDETEEKNVETGKENTGRNPFLPPDPDLFVCHLSETHSLVLNKFNVVPRHVIIVTRAFVRQDTPLSLEDMSATWTVVRSMPSPGGLAYFNCGPVSGASQPHKHVQVIPLPINPNSKSNHNEKADDPPFQGIIDKALRDIESRTQGTFGSIDDLPFSNFVARIDAAATDGKRLADLHDALVRSASNAVGVDDPYANDNFSYNTIFTSRFMMVVPRRSESFGPVSCNAMAFAGSFFVRSKQELEFIRHEGPLRVLEEVGFPN